MRQGDTITIQGKIIRIDGDRVDLQALGDARDVVRLAHEHAVIGEQQPYALSEIVRIGDVGEDVVAEDEFNRPVLRRLDT